MVVLSVITNMGLLIVSICVLVRYRQPWWLTADLFQTVMCIIHIVIVDKLTVHLCQPTALLVLDVSHVIMGT